MYEPLSEEQLKVVAKRPRPAVVMVLDGFGVAPDGEGNAITRARMPFFHELGKRYPTMTLKSSGATVGLMWGEMGNSEVGHLTIGSGRVYYQALPRVERTIEEENFFEIEAFKRAMAHVKETGGTLHLLGIMSSGKIHGYNKHCYELLRMAKKNKVKKVAVHAILDGRDTLYNSGVEFIEELEEQIRTIGVGRIASVSGRYYAMDRDNHWDRTQKAYEAIALGQSDSVTENPIEAIKASYAQEVYDEEFYPTVITQKGKATTIDSGDATIFFNFRPDRARQMTKALVLPEFDKFVREYISHHYFVCMMEYEKGLPVDLAFPQVTIDNCLAEVISNAGLVQLHIAETEKYAHVTFFFNGNREQAFPNEDRVIIPSPAVSSYDQAPAMSSREITDRVVKEIRTDNYDIIIMNYANSDMVGHTGNLEATIQAHEVLDESVKRVVDEVLLKDGVVLITADHGNAEELLNIQTSGMDKEHSTNPVPFYIIGKQFEGQPGLAGDVPNGDLSLMPPVGMLSDIAPTLLKILGIPQPPEMTGAPLI